MMVRLSAGLMACATEEQGAAAERLRREATDRSGPALPPKRPDENAPEGNQ